MHGLTARLSESARVLFGRERRAVIDRQAADQTGCVGNTLPEASEVRLSLETLHQTASALRYLTDSGIVRPEVIDALLASRTRLAVILQLQPAAVETFTDRSDFVGFAETCQLLNAMIGTRINYVPAGEHSAVVYDEERLRHAILSSPQGSCYSGKEQYAARLDDGLVLLLVRALGSAGGPLCDLINRPVLDERIVEAAGALSAALRSDSPLPLPEGLIQDLAFPSARNAQEVEGVVRSYLAACRVFRRPCPRIWLFDECSGDAALEKQMMLQRLAREYQLDARYVGRAEKELFLDLLQHELESEDLTPAGEVLRRQIFPDRVLGTQRNLVHTYLSGRPYATADDDSFGAVTTNRSGLYNDTIRGRKLERVLKSIGEATRSIVGEGARGATAERACAADAVFSDMVDMSLRTSVSLLQILFSADRSAADGFDRTLLATFLQAAGRSSLRANGKRAQVTLPEFCVPWEKLHPEDMVRVPVDVFGIHNAAIGKASSELAAQCFGEIEGSRVDEVCGESCCVVFVSSSINLTAPGSANNDIDAFLSGKTYQEACCPTSRAVFVPASSHLANRYTLCTTTFTSVDNRVPTGILLPGVLDSFELKLAVQGNDPSRGLYNTSIALDHVRQGRPWLNESDAAAHGRRIIRELVYEALDVGSGSTIEERTQLFAAAIMTLVGGLWDEQRATRKLLEPVRARLEDVERKAKKSKKPKKAASGGYAGRLRADEQRLKGRLKVVEGVMAGMEAELGLKLISHEAALRHAQRSQNGSMLQGLGYVRADSFGCGKALLEARNNRDILQRYLENHDQKRQTAARLAPAIHQAAQRILSAAGGRVAKDASVE